MSLLEAPRQIDLGELHNRRHAALVSADSRNRDVEALSRRIHQGNKKIGEARDGGADKGALDRANLKLVELEDELQQTRLRWLVPAEVIDAFYSLAQSLCSQGLPEGSYVSAVIPGYLDICVGVDDAHEPPF